MSFRTIPVPCSALLGLPAIHFVAAIRKGHHVEKKGGGKAVRGRTSSRNGAAGKLARRSDHPKAANVADPSWEAMVYEDP